MSVGTNRRRGGSFGAISGPEVGTERSRQLVDDDELTGEMLDAMEADDFIIYGRASVEKYDDDNPPQKLEMEAFADEVDDFFERGIISRRHKDIPVGEPLEEWSLDEPTTVTVGDEDIDFDAGDTLKTGFQDGELWIVANIGNDSELARETRYGAMTGNLDGFSVTVFVKEWEETERGQRVTSLDWHSVTIGDDDLIKNDDSQFGVADFKMFELASGVSSPKAAGAVQEILGDLPPDMTDEKGFWARVREKAARKEQEAGGDPPEDTKQGDASGADEADQKEYSDEEYDEKGDDYGDEEDYDEGGGGGATMMSEDAAAVVEKVRDEMGDEDADVLEEEMMGGDGHGDGHEDEYAGEGEELKAGDVADKLNGRFAGKSEVEDLKSEIADLKQAVEEGPSAEDVKSELDERLPDGDVATKSEVQDVVDTAEQVITDTLPEAQKSAAADAAEQTAEKMATGSTPDPSTGPANDENDYREQITSQFGTEKAGGD